MRKLLPILLLAAFSLHAQTILTFDFPAVHIGIAEYDEGPTGATVFYFPNGARAAVDVRGGSPATMNTDFLRLSYESPFIDAISFAGGSSYGLEAATGVAAEIRAKRGGSGEWTDIATVLGAIIFDLGPRRFNTTYPDKELGRAAFRAAKPGMFPLGARGAGRFAMQGGYFGGWEYRQYSGQGGAFRQSGPTKVAVFAVVNALGAVVDRNGNLIRCLRREGSTRCPTASEYLSEALRRKTAQRAASTTRGRFTESTTISVVITNQKLEFWELQRLAIQVHTSMARAIQPFHTERDGDVLFAVTTAEVENESMSGEDLGTLASEVAWDAILSSIPSLPDPPRPGSAPSADTLARFAGTYEFATGARLTITRDGSSLHAEASGERAIYGIAPKQRVELVAVSERDFFTGNARRDVIRFEDGSLTLNPGHWGLQARRVR